MGIPQDSIGEIRARTEELGDISRVAEADRAISAQEYAHAQDEYRQVMEALAQQATRAALVDDEDQKVKRKMNLLNLNDSADNYILRAHGYR